MRRLFAEGAFAHAFVPVLSDGWWLFFARVLLAAGGMSVGLYYFVDVDWWNNWNSTARVISLVKWIGLGLVIYATTLLATGLRAKHLIENPQISAAKAADLSE